jgi:hypothetical protein
MSDFIESGRNFASDVSVGGRLSVGDSNSVSSAPLADSGEFVPLFTQMINEEISTTSTSFVESTASIGNSPTFESQPIELTNLQSFGVSYYVIVENTQPGESVTVRLKNQNTGNVFLPTTFSSAGIFADATAGVAELTGINATASSLPETIDIRFEHKVSGGTGITKRPRATLYGKLK